MLRQKRFLLHKLMIPHIVARMVKLEPQIAVHQLTVQLLFNIQSVYACQFRNFRFQYDISYYISQLTLYILLV